MHESALLITFTVDREQFGIVHGAVDEVIEPGPVAPVPKAPPEIAGLYNHRGKILTVIDFDRLCGGAAKENGKSRFLIILSGIFSHLSLLAHSRPTAVRLDEFERGTLHLAHRLYDILDPPIVVSDGLYNMISPEKMIQHLHESIIQERLLIGVK
jgi:chemotaxis signal transduction protein